MPSFPATCKAGKTLEPQNQKIAAADIENKRVPTLKRGQGGGERKKAQSANSCLPLKNHVICALCARVTRWACGIQNRLEIR
jgi:hypothetical protein